MSQSSFTYSTVLLAHPIGCTHAQCDGDAFAVAVSVLRGA
eukprot:COSAG02_NODE_43_length_45989_cov_93.430181_48_plen_40_part_00